MVRLPHFIFFCLFILVILNQCNQGTDWEIVHPVAERLPQGNNSINSIDITSRQENPIQRFFDPIGIKFHLSIGDSSSLGDEYYSPTKVRIGYDGNVYIMHKHTNAIRVYNSIGIYQYSIGKGGRGPGELNEITTFDLDIANQRLYIFDHSFKIEVYVRNKGLFKYERTIYHRYIQTYDACLLNDSIFISGYSSHQDLDNPSQSILKPIARINLLTENTDLTFGYLYPSYSGYSNYSQRLSETLLSCHQESNTVVGYLRHFPFIFGYNVDGITKWVSRIDGYVSPEFTEFKKSQHRVPGLIPYSNQEVFNYTYPIQKIDVADFSILQFGWTGPQPIINPNPRIRREDKEPRYRTILIDTESGELFHSDAYPLIGAMQKGKMVTYEILEPYQIKFSLNTYP